MSKIFLVIIALFISFSACSKDEKKKNPLNSHPKNQDQRVVFLENQKIVFNLGRMKTLLPLKEREIIKINYKKTYAVREEKSIKIPIDMVKDGYLSIDICNIKGISGRVDLNLSYGNNDFLVPISTRENDPLEIIRKTKGYKPYRIYRIKCTLRGRGDHITSLPKPTKKANKQLASR